jgi:hypothetical protein
MTMPLRPEAGDGCSVGSGGTLGEGPAGVAAGTLGLGDVVPEGAVAEAVVAD